MNKSKHPPSVILLFVLLQFTLHGPSCADLLLTLCTNTSTYTPNSVFASNLKRFLQFIPSKASLTGYYNTSIGSRADQVYGHALCRGDVTASVCQYCLQTAAQGIIEQCPKGREATIFYELCEIRYSIHNFFSTMVYNAKYPAVNMNTTLHRISDHDAFNKALRGLLGKLATKAVYDSHDSFFATGKVGVSGGNKIYGLAQCTKDLSRESCNECLQDTLGNLVGCCCRNEAGILLSQSCNMRFALDQFYQISNTGKGEKRKRGAIIASIVIALPMFLIGFCIYHIYHKYKKRKASKDIEINRNMQLNELGAPIETDVTYKKTIGNNETENQELPLIDVATIRVATDNFSDSNKLGQGGFGIVYKGVLPDGKEVAVKRLSQKSRQGFEEFKNEIILIAKLQHRNLVRLLGCSIEGEEKLLVYEFMSNKSLDYLLFDPAKSVQLNWNIRFNIIANIARGLLYLHEDSRLKVIHRDLKPNNVLLDDYMNAKISDFGMARIFGENQMQCNTSKVAGTYGYMAPEYAMGGLFSVKSDVFSFGVVLLEIVSGKRSNGFYLIEHSQNLLTYAWHQWNKGKGLDFVDPTLTETCSTQEVLRCIHIGLLCVQKEADERPTMSTVLVALGSEQIDLPRPAEPAFFIGKAIRPSLSSSSRVCSVNELTISSLSPR